MMMQNASLQFAIQLARSGHKDEALRILLEIVKEEPRNETAWIWLADTLANPMHRLAALQQGLKENPDSRLLQDALDILQPAPPPKIAEAKDNSENQKPAFPLESSSSHTDLEPLPETSWVNISPDLPKEERLNNLELEREERSVIPGWVMIAIVLLIISIILIGVTILWIWKSLPAKDSFSPIPSNTPFILSDPTFTLSPLNLPTLSPSLPPLTKTPPHTPTLEPSATLHLTSSGETPTPDANTIPGLTPQELIVYLENSANGYECDEYSVYAAYSYGYCQAEPGWNVMISIEFHGDPDRIRSIDVTARSTKKNFAALNTLEIQNTIDFIARLSDIPYVGSQPETFLSWWSENAPLVVTSGGEYNQIIGGVEFSISKEDPSYVINLLLGVYN
jgi:hypothetical protein